MTGFETALLISQLAGPIMSMFGGGDDQVRQSFEGKGAISPEAMMRNALGVSTNLGQALGSRAAQPISLPSAYAQQPGAYSGGGLPMPIGLVASDPALTNPSLLSRPGMDSFASIFSGLSGSGDTGGFPNGPGRSNPPGAGMQPGDSFIPGSDIDPDGPLGGDVELGDAFDNFFQTPFDQRTNENPQGTTDVGEPNPGNSAERVGGPRRRQINDGEYGQLVRADDLLADSAPGDDLQQAMGAVNLLLEAFGQRPELA